MALADLIAALGGDPSTQGSVAGITSGLPQGFIGGMGAQQAMAAPPSPANDIDLNATPGNGVTTGVAPPPPTAPAPAPSPWDILRSRMAADPSQQAPAALAPPPMPVQSNHLGDVLDSVLLDGALRKTRDASFQRQMAAYQAQQTYRIASSIQDPQMRAAYLANPAKYGEEVAKNLAPVTRSAGQETQFGEGGPIVGTNTTGLDPVSGKPYTLSPTGAFTAGPSLGGGYDPTTGVSTRTADQARVQTFQKILPGETGSFVAPPIGGPLGGAVPPAIGGAPNIGGASGGVSMPRAIRNNNPLNLTTPGGGQWDGQTGTDGKFAQFASPAAGMAAADKNLAAYGSQHGINTLQGVVNRWAPASDGNDPVSYAATVSKATGIPVDAPIDLSNPAVRAAILPAMAKVEIGRGGRGATPTSIAGVPSSLQGKTVAPPVWNPATNQYEQTGPDGKVTSVGSAPFSPEKLRDTVLSSEDYKQAQAAMGAYTAMRSNAGQMTGPGAYSMLDTFARAINPGAVARPTVIQTLEHSLGPLNSVPGGWDRLVGQGNLTPAVRQQILDSVHGFVQAHYGQAKALNDQNAAIATRMGMDPRNVVAPLDAAPPPHFVTLPPKSQLKQGATYTLPSGKVGLYDGKQFVLQ